METKFEKPTLREMQAWTLDQKIYHSIEVIQTFMTAVDGKAYVSFSGGKDSTVLLDICRRFVDKDIPAVFVNTGNEFPEIVKFVRSFDNITILRPKMSMKKVINKYGFPLVSKEQSKYIYEARTTNSKTLYDQKMGLGRFGDKFSISKKWRWLVNEDFSVSHKCCDKLKKQPAKRYEKKTGLNPIIGDMAEESRLRNSDWIRRGGCNIFGNRPASHPLSIWTDKDIWDYIKKYNIPYCELYDKGHNRTGCMMCGFGAQLGTNKFELLKQQHPKVYTIYSKFENNGVTYEEAINKVMSIK